jgi:tetratricopeptide (TPR) repeat protein
MLRRVITAAALVSLAAAPTPAPADREAARRKNNLGVALMEQFRFDDAAAAFREAAALDAGYAGARINLGIALFHAPDLAGARGAFEAARALAPDAPQVHYVPGLIDRQENRVEDALARFRRVLAVDPRDVGANVNAAQVLLQERRYAEAIPLLEAAFAAEPYHVTAAYNLGLALTRSGRTEEGARITARFQELRDSPYRTALGNNYLERGRYAEAIASNGAEPELVDRRAPTVAFVDRTKAWLPAAKARAAADRASASGVALADLDADGDLDLLDATGPGLRLLRNEGGRFADATAGSGAGIAALAAVAGDLDNDGHADIVALQARGVRLLKGDGAWRFQDVTSGAGLGAVEDAAVAAALVDVDHDGDLDLFVPTASAQRLLRNNGDGTFADVAGAAKLATPEGTPVAVLPTDFDERRDVDLLVVHGDAPPALYKNLRDGSFADVAAEVGLPASGGFRCASAADVNKDGFTDFFFGGDGAGTLALSDGRGRFALETSPHASAGTRACLFLDYDRDGLLDLALLTGAGPRLLRNLGRSWEEVAPATASIRGLVLGPGLAAGDLDGDGAQDLIAAGPDGPRVLGAEGAGGRSFTVSLAGRVSNRGGVGAKLEIRAGSLRQKLELTAATPAAGPADAVFGLGARQAPDAVRVLWPSGILQTEIELPAAGTRTAALAVKELDRKPSSCPYLYAWDGERFAFVTDFLGGGEMGYRMSPTAFNVPDPDEYVLLPESFRARDGRYELRVTNELEEVLFLDRAVLLAVDHPEDVAVFPYEGMTAPPKPSRLLAAQGLRPPVGARDDHGHDVLARLLALDRSYPDDFELHRIRGYAEEHGLVLDLGPPGSRADLLLLTGWTDYAFSSDNVAAAQAGIRMQPPRLEVRDAEGKWRTAVEQVGIAVGRPQTVVVDLAGKWLSPSREVRIVTNMRIYWDRAQVAASAGPDPTPRALRPASAELRERGFSAEVSPDGREPYGYDYTRVSWDAPWKLIPGHYTRPGGVGELLEAADDLYVISRPGDEVRLAFDAAALPALPAGWRRSFVLAADGFSKEMDINSATPDRLGPLPFRAMSRYPYGAPEAYPMTEARRAVIERYTTRYVGPVVPSLDRALALRNAP